MQEEILGYDIETLNGETPGDVFDGYGDEDEEAPASAEQKTMDDDLVKKKNPDEDTKKIFVNFVKDKLKEIFNDNSTISEIEDNLYTIKIEKMDLEFKTSTIYLLDIEKTLMLIKDVIDFKIENKKYYILNDLISQLEEITSVSLVKHETSESLSVIIYVSEQLPSGESVATKKIVMSICNIVNDFSYDYAVKNNLINISLEELHKKHNSILCKTYKSKIERLALVYANILETIEKYYEESTVYVDFNFYFNGVDLRRDEFSYLTDLFSYIGFYDVRLRGSIDNDFTNPASPKTVKDKKKEEEEEKEDPINFSSIYGLDSIKEEFRIIAESMKYKFNNKGTKLSIPKGILLVGAPGTGKSFITKAFAKEFSLQLLLLSSWTGDNNNTSNAIKGCFNHASQASKYGPVIIFIDELDKIITRNNEESMATLLEMLSADGDYIVIGACNSDAGFPPALTRPGRFDKKMYFGDLSAVSKISIFKKILDKKEIDYKQVDIPAIIDYLPSEITVATLEAIAKQALILKVILKQEIDTVKMLNICESILEGTSETVKTNRESLERTAWHEAGHAVVGLLLDKKITVATIKRSYKYLGYVMWKYDEEEILVYEDYVKTIKACIGGWAAEKLIYNDLSLGASADFSIMQNVINYLTTFAGDSGTNLISTSISLNINQSLEERKDMYNAKKVKTKKYVSSTLKLLKKHRPLLNKVYDILMRNEKVSGIELEAIFKEYKDKNKGIRKLLLKAK